MKELPSLAVCRLLHVLFVGRIDYTIFYMHQLLFCIRYLSISESADLMFIHATLCVLKSVSNPSDSLV